jgi:hypothetical protein
MTLWSLRSDFARAEGLGISSHLLKIRTRPRLLRVDQGLARRAFLITASRSMGSVTHDDRIGELIVAN